MAARSGSASPMERTAAIPVWMTDRVACAALSVGPVLVAVEGLLEHASLVATTRSAHDRITQPSQEEPDATSTTETNADPVPIPFERVVPAVVLPAPIAQDLVKALADLLLASAGNADHDEERDDAREGCKRPAGPSCRCGG